MKVRDVVKLLEANGGYLARTRGSHHQYKHPTKPGLVTVPGSGGGDLAPGTLNSPLKAGGAEGMGKYLIVIEETEAGFSAYSPDLPGCVSTGGIRDEVERNMREAIEFHLDGLQQDGQPSPKRSTSAAYVEVAA